MKFFTKIVPHIPTILEFCAGIISILSALKCKWWVQAIVILAFIALAIFFILVYIYPYSVDVEHPIDTVGRFAQELTGYFSK